MHINNAINLLNDARQRGVKHIIINWWEASNFELAEGITWEKASKQAGLLMDWDGAKEDLESQIKYSMQSQHAFEALENSAMATPKSQINQK